MSHTIEFKEIVFNEKVFDFCHRTDLDLCRRKTVVLFLFRLVLFRLALFRLVLFRLGSLFGD